MSNYKIQTGHNLICTTFYGVTDSIVMTQYIHDLQKEVLSFEGKEWAAMVDFRDWELAGPEISKYTNAQHEWNVEHNIKASAFLIAEETKKLQLWTLGNYLFNEHLDFAARIFTDKDEAMEWLRKEGYSL